MGVLPPIIAHIVSFLWPITFRDPENLLSSDELSSLHSFKYKMSLRPNWEQSIYYFAGSRGCSTGHMEITWV